MLTYIISWTCFISVAVLSHRVHTNTLELSTFQQVLLFLGTIAPSLVALWIVARSGVPGETQKLLNRVGKWQVNIGWYIFATGYIAIIKLAVALIYRIITGAWPQFGHEAWYIIVIAIIFSTWVQAGEEIGWRGFALPRMSERFGLSLSTLLLGVLWACWHLPLFFVQGVDKYGQSFPLFLMQVTLLSVAMGWLYWRTKGSLLLTMLMHAAVNNTKDIVPSIVPGAKDPFAFSRSPVAWLTVTLLGICAGLFLFQMRMVRTIAT